MSSSFGPSGGLIMILSIKLMCFNYYLMWRLLGNIEKKQNTENNILHLSKTAHEV